jgi:hypothetical protein
MQKVVLSEVDVYTGEVAMPKGFEIDRNVIKNHIIESYINKKRITDNPKSYSFDDYEIDFSQPLQWLQDYIRDHWRVEYGHSLVTKTMHGNVMHPKEKSSECIIEYDDNRRKNRTWHIPIENNKFIMFPATNRYSFSPNTSNSLNIILTINSEYI